MLRRNFCKNTLLAIASLGLPSRVMAQVLPRFDTGRELSFFNTHTGESLERVIYWSQGRYVSDALTQIDYLLRDHRTEQVAPIDPGLLDTLYLLSRKLDCQEPLQVISGYRSPSTNAGLRLTTSGVAKGSLHMQGRAIDIRLTGCGLDHLYSTALGLERGGVGYYPDSEFVHLDTGSFRTWQG